MTDPLFNFADQMRGQMAMDTDASTQQKLKSGDRVAIDIGRRTIVGTLTKPRAGGTKFGVATDEGEYTMMLADIRRH